MRQKSYSRRIVWYLAITVIIVVSFFFIDPIPTAAQSIEEYFQISYGPVSFSKDEINGNEVFYATIGVEVTCIKDLPTSVSKVRVTGRVIGKHKLSDRVTILNSDYTTTINPVPSIEGYTTKINKVVPLQFPDQTQSGDYDVIGEFIKVEIDIGVLRFSITEPLPQPQAMGSIKYISPNPITESTFESTTTPESVESSATRWVWLIAIICIVAGILLGWFLMYLRMSKTAKR